MMACSQRSRSRCRRTVRDSSGRRWRRRSTTSPPRSASATNCAPRHRTAPGVPPPRGLTVILAVATVFRAVELAACPPGPPCGAAVQPRAGGWWSCLRPEHGGSSSSWPLRLRLRGGGSAAGDEAQLAAATEPGPAEGEPAGAGDEEEPSAAPEDRGELRAPYYDGVRVQCLFVHEDTKEEQWCSGKIQYTKLSTRELRIAFDEVPSWETVRRIYWPIDDEDIRVVPGQEGGPSLSPEERHELSKEMLAMCQVFDWHRVRRALWFGADPTYSENLGQTVLHIAAAADELDTVKAVVRRSENKVAMLNLETREGNTPLHYAATSSEALVLRILLRAGANMAAKNKYGHLPLHFAEAAGNALGYKMLHDAMAKRLAELRQRGAPAGAKRPSTAGKETRAA